MFSKEFFSKSSVHAAAVFTVFTVLAFAEIRCCLVIQMEYLYIHGGLGREDLSAQVND